ncbi:MAG: tRNA (adenosine(37)-N6)-threonylcarbamoyltransferase complex ATPase subunit type 1 TsaE [Verrucomicrobia bacterium]|nr:MAG: tRNA (adenosine(37)-N6)-threonylcarbamoyltransferase complex ATPase subunit type 1 TsaE [Verrucomicrobiota bacterium]
MVTLISNSPAETEAIGRRWGEEAVRGMVFALTGDLGAGKTQLVRGLAAGLGSPARVSSPTFVLVHEYGGGRLPLFHLDLYRLSSPAEVIDAGLAEYLLDPDGVTVVEWAERWFGPGPASAPSAGRLRQVWIETVSETVRRIRHVDSGS